MKTLVLAIALLFSALPTKAADSTLVLITTEARGALRSLFTEWLHIVRDVETNNPGGVFVVELPSWDRNWTNQNWGMLNSISNLVAKHNPKTVFLVGNHPYCVLGKWISDGHDYRAMASDQWLAISDFSASDTVNHTEITGYNASTAPLYRNIPGDGRPDQVTGTYARRVGRVDFAGLSQPPGDTLWSGGCLDGLYYNPTINEAVGLSNYFRANIDYRLGKWSVTPNGFMTGGFSSDRFATVTAALPGITWTNSAAPMAMQNALISYDSWDGYEIKYAYGDSCVPPKYVFNFNTRSYGMEVNRQSSVPFRRLAPGRESHPYALVFGWNYLYAVYWRVSTADVIAGDIIQTSAAAFGYVDLGLNFHGDPTLPIHPNPPKSALGRINISSITLTNK